MADFQSAFENVFSRPEYSLWQQLDTLSPLIFSQAIHTVDAAARREKLNATVQAWNELTKKQENIGDDESAYATALRGLKGSLGDGDAANEINDQFVEYHAWYTQVFYDTFGTFEKLQAVDQAFEALSGKVATTQEVEKNLNEQAKCQESIKSNPLTAAAKQMEILELQTQQRTWQAENAKALMEYYRKVKDAVNKLPTWKQVPNPRPPRWRG